MATIIAKYRSHCGICGRLITPGERIEYTKGQPSRHADCTPVQVPLDAIYLSIGQGYASPHFGGWLQGQIIHNRGRKLGSSAEKAQRERARLGQAWEAAHPEERMPDGPPETHWERYKEWSKGMTERYKARIATKDAAITAEIGPQPAGDDGPEYLYVLSASQRYYREDGMSFGVGDEKGYVYSAVCRAATEAEVQQKDAPHV